ncbi:MAG: amino acid ABC transporter permease [Treponema sp.]|jgi:L-cystine transport system permease protein|nr:amino acid ABC transporter permease [Treponema sp.]
MEFRFVYIFTVIPKLLPYLGITLLIALLTLVVGLLLGALLAWAKLGNITVLRKLAYGYTSVIRCTPPLILLFMSYYGLPKLFSLFGIDINDIDKLYFVLTAFILLYTAVLSELIRSTYEAIDPGQFEAAASVGMTGWQALRRIIIPQGVFFAIPNLGNTVISLLKEGSLAFTIGLIDVMGRAKMIISLNYGAHALEIYLALALVYWGLTFLVVKAVRFLEDIFNIRKENSAAPASKGRGFGRRRHDAVQS